MTPILLQDYLRRQARRGRNPVLTLAASLLRCVCWAADDAPVARETGYFGSGKGGVG